MKIFEIVPGLFQSTEIDDKFEVTKLGIDVVIDLEGGLDDIYYWSIKSYLYWHILDVPWLPDLDHLWNMARYGFNAWKQGEKVLTH